MSDDLAPLDALPDPALMRLIAEHSTMRRDRIDGWHCGCGHRLGDGDVALDHDAHLAAVIEADGWRQVEAAETVEWGFESPQPGLMYVTRNPLLAETMQAGRPDAAMCRRPSLPWGPVDAGDEAGS